MDTSRVIVAVILSLILIFAYQELVLKKLYPPPSEQQKTQKSQATQPTVAPGVPAAIATAVAGATATAQSLAAPRALSPAPGGPPPRIITVTTDLYIAKFTTEGARLTSFRLRRYSEAATPGSPPYEMIPQGAGGLLPLGVLLDRSGTISDDHMLSYTTSAPDQFEVASDRTETIEFSTETASGDKIVKSFSFNGASYAFTMNVNVASSGPALDAMGLGLSQSLTEKTAGFRDIPELQADVSGKVITESQSKLAKGAPDVTGPVSFAGFGDRYFLTAYLPKSPDTATLAMSYEGDQAFARLLFAKTSDVRTGIYMGPKLLEALEAADPALNKAIDFGWLGLIAMPFLRALKLFHYIAPNWGWDIILLTIVLRVLLLPMSIRGQRSMLKMQRLQPQMERLREKYKDQQERLQQEMVDLYKRNHVNPLGGCLPTALQFPVFIGLYEALLNAVELRHAPFMLWIKDLSAPDCFPVSWMPQLPFMHCHGIPVLVLLMGASTFLQQWMTPTSPDPNQQRMMMLTPLIFMVMFVNFPAGLSLYYFASNALGIIQQVVLNREFKNAPVTAAAA